MTKANSIFTRLFLSFMIVLTPLVVLGFLLFHQSEATISKEIEKSVSQNVSFLQNTFEQDVSNIKLLQHNLRNNKALGNFMIYGNTLDRADYYMAIKDIRDQAAMIKFSNRFIEEVFIYFTDSKSKISAVRGISQVDEQVVEQVVARSQSGQSPLIFQPEENSVILSLPSYFNKNGRPQYVIELKITTEMLSDYLSKYSTDFSSDTAMLDVNSGVCVAANNIKDNGGLNEQDYINILQNNCSSGIVNYNHENYYAEIQHNKLLNITFIQLVKMNDLFQVLDNNKVLYWLYLLFCFAVVIFFSLSTFMMVERPIIELMKAFAKVENGKLNTRVSKSTVNEFKTLFNGFNSMIVQLNVLIDKNFRQELYTKEIKLKLLQTQINPHFLYNSYFVLHRMIINEDIDEAKDISKHLGIYMKYITRNANQDVPLKEEYDNLFSYAQIQQVRFQNTLVITFDQIPVQYQDFGVPKLILQPILENCLEHCVRKAQKKTVISVSVMEAYGFLTISIEDNGEKLPEEAITALRNTLEAHDEWQETTGLINVHRRIRIKYGEDSGIVFDRSILGGLRVKIKIWIGTHNEGAEKCIGS